MGRHGEFWAFENEVCYLKNAYIESYKTIDESLVEYICSFVHVFIATFCLFKLFQGKPTERVVQMVYIMTEPQKRCVKISRLCLQTHLLPLLYLKMVCLSACMRRRSEFNIFLTIQEKTFGNSEQG